MTEIIERPAVAGNAVRLHCLDSLRGLAACVVICSHIWLMNSLEFRDAHHGFPSALTSPLNALLWGYHKLFAGRASVIMFFVLSGFVLAYSLQKTPMAYVGYVLKRVFRIYPVFLFIVLASYALHSLIGIHHITNSDWLDDIVTVDLSLKTLLKHCLLWGTAGSNKLDGVIWSLVHEMRISLVFPFLLAAIVRYRWRAVMASFALSLACTFWFLHSEGHVAQGYDAINFVRTLVNTAYFIVFFAVGAWLAITRERVTQKIAAAPPWLHGLLFVFCLYCFLKAEGDNHTFMGSVVDYFRGLGSVGIIALALGNQRFQKALEHRIPIWLGRVSYSLYLVHIPILYALNQTIGATWSVAQTALILFPLSLLAAEILARTIEFPFIHVGKKLCQKFAAPSA